MFNNTSKIVYAVLFLLAFIVRKIFTSRNKKQEIIISKKSTADFVFLFFDGIGMIVPLIYVFSTWFDFADYSLPDWTGWIGTGLFAIAIWVLYASHAHLDSNWIPVLAIHKEHTLVTSGIYKYIRHPMYAAHILWAIAQILILHNWIAGYSFFIVMVPHYLARVGKEESMMIEQFGGAYEDYMKSTGRIFPKFS